MTGRKDRRARQVVEYCAAQRIDFGNPIDFIPKEFDPQSDVFFVGRIDFDPVTPYPEGAPMKVDIIAFVVDLYQAAQQGIALHHGIGFNIHPHAEIVLGGPQSVDTGHTGHHDNIPA